MLLGSYEVSLCGLPGQGRSSVQIMPNLPFTAFGNVVIRIGFQRLDLATDIPVQSAELRHEPRTLRGQEREVREFARPTSPFRVSDPTSDRRCPVFALM